MALNDKFIKNSTKHSGKPSGDKYTDGRGMYLLVTAAGRYWRFNYRYDGKRKTLALGVYPTVSLAEARKRNEKARELSNLSHLLKSKKTNTLSLVFCD